MIKERPILFSAPMVRALLDGSKTQTRRVCKPAEAAGLIYVTGIQDPRDFGQRPLEVAGSGWFGDEEGEVQFRSPYGRPGDRLWVRETWQHSNWPAGPYDEECEVFYRADYMDDPHGPDGERSPERKYRTWRPSIHMPRTASRILLEITGVRVERLQDITEADARAEGVQPHEVRQFALFGLNADERAELYRQAAVGPYRGLWESINGAGRWDTNPWVWGIAFQRITP